MCRKRSLAGAALLSTATTWRVTWRASVATLKSSGWSASGADIAVLVVLSSCWRMTAGDAGGSAGQMPALCGVVKDQRATSLADASSRDCQPLVQAPRPSLDLATSSVDVRDCGAQPTSTSKQLISDSSWARRLLLMLAMLLVLLSSSCVQSDNDDGLRAVDTVQQHQPAQSINSTTFKSLIINPPSLRMARVKGITQFYLPPTRLSTNGMSNRAFNPRSKRITAICPVLISRPTEGRRLSWPVWRVSHRGGMPTRRRSPIPVPSDR